MLTGTIDGHRETDMNRRSNRVNSAQKTESDALLARRCDRAEWRIYWFHQGLSGAPGVAEPEIGARKLTTASARVIFDVGRQAAITGPNPLPAHPFVARPSAPLTDEWSARSGCRSVFSVNIHDGQ